MSNKVITGFIVALVCIFLPAAPWALAQPVDGGESDKSQEVRKAWDDFMYYALIGDWDLAQGTGQKLLQLDPDPVALLNLVQGQQQLNYYKNLAQLQSDSPVSDLARQILERVEEGRHRQRTDPGRIADEVRRLSSTPRGRIMARDRLIDSGEWAVPIMIQALRDPSRSDEYANISWALPKLGKPAVNPLVMVLQQHRELNIRLVVLDALGKIGYKSALPYIQQVVESQGNESELQSVGSQAIAAIQGGQTDRAAPASVLFEQLAQAYYNDRPSLRVPANQDFANVWFWTDAQGLSAVRVDRGAFDELMSMRCSEFALSLNPNLATSISLWVSAFFRLEAEGHPQPDYFAPNHLDADTYALTSGPRYLHQVLQRALHNRNRPVALSAIHVLQRNFGQEDLLFDLGAQQPLLVALQFPDKEVRFSAALAIAGALPSQHFEHDNLVTPILAEALQQRGNRYALVVDNNEERRNRLVAQLRDSNAFTEIVNDGNFASGLEQIKRVPSIDLVVLAQELVRPSLIETLEIMGKDYRLGFCPTIVISGPAALSETVALKATHPFLEVTLNQTEITAAELQAMEETSLARNHAVTFDQSKADEYAHKAAGALLQLAVTENQVLPLSDAEVALLRVVSEEDRRTIQGDAIQTLARMDSIQAQREIATMALDGAVDQETRLMALEYLSLSSKAYGNLLVAEQIEGLLAVVNAVDAPVGLRNLAAQAYGSLNLPSITISELITDQIQTGESQTTVSNNSLAGQVAQP